jgi:hypothetical protein
MADAVEQLLALQPTAPMLPEAAQALPPPAFAKPCWELLF